MDKKLFDKVVSALEPKCRCFGIGNIPRQIAEELAIAVVEAISPPAANTCDPATISMPTHDG